jgi:parvulin-like peptidyl-prolyl isomerase
MGMTARNWTLRLFAFAGAIVILVGPGQAQAPKSPAGPAAVVNGDPISYAEVDAVVKMMPAPPAPPTDGQMRIIRHEALELLMNDVLLRHFLIQHGRPVAPPEIEKQMTQLQTALRAQNHTLVDFLKDTSQTEAHLRVDIAKKIQWDDYVKQLATDSNLRRYYEANKDYYDRVTVKASHILLRVSPGASPGESQAAEAKLQEMRRQILAGKLDFAAAARQYSQCDSALRGGDIGYFPRKWVVEEPIASAAFSLKVGDVSDVLRTDYGCHLVKVTDRKPGQPSSYEAAKEEVRENFAMDLRERILAQERKAAKIEIALP